MACTALQAGVSQACHGSQSRTDGSGPRRRCRGRIKCRVQDHRCRARWMEPPWASSTASSLQQLACQRRLRVWGPGEGPPSRQQCQVAGSWPPVFAAARGGGMPRHKLAWSRDGGDPKSLAHSFYRRAAARLDSMCTTWPGCCHVPWRQLHPSNPPEVPEYVPAYLPTQLGKKKGDLFLVVVWKGGGGG